MERINKHIGNSSHSTSVITRLRSRAKFSKIFSVVIYIIEVPSAVALTDITPIKVHTFQVVISKSNNSSHF